MADDVRQLLLQIDATTTLLRSNLNKAERQIADWEAGTKRRLDNVDRNFARVGSGISRLERPLVFLKSGIAGVAAAAGLLGVGAAAGVFLRYADQAKQLAAQLQLATAETGNFAEAQADVQRIAEATRSSLNDVGQLYGSFVRSGAELGRTQDDAARATETFQKALALGGASATDAANATRQFNQALAGGILRAEEFNSVTEASPRVQRLLAESLGVTSGKLRALVVDGKVTSQQLFEALTGRDYTAKIDAEFSRLPVTVEQAMTLVDNAAQSTIGEFDRGGGFSEALASFVSDGARGFANLAETAREEGIAIRAAFDVLHDAFQPLLDSAQGAFGGIRQEVNWTRESIANILSGIDTLRNFLPDLQRRAQQFDERVFGFRTGYTGDLGPRSNLEGAFRGAVGERRIATRFGGGTNVGGAGPAGGRRVEGNGSADAQTPAQARAAARRAEAEARRAEREAEADRRRDAQVQDEIGRINIEIARRAADLSGVVETRAEVERASVDFERTSQLRRVEIDRDLTAAQRASLTAAINQRATAERAAIDEEERRQIAQREFDLASAGNRGEAAAVQSRLQLARTASERLRMERRLLDLQYSQEEADLNNIMATNAVGSARYEEARAMLARLDERKANDIEGIERRNASPLRQLLLDLPQDAAEIEEALEGIAANGLDRLTDDLADVLTGVGSLEEAFSNLAKSIIRDLARIAIQQTIIKPLAESLFGNGGGGNIFQSLAGVIMKGGGGYGGPKALGGSVEPGRSYLVGETGPERFVPKVAGHIIPNNYAVPKMQAAGGVSLSTSITVDARGAQAGVAEQIETRLAQVIPETIRASVQATITTLSRPGL